MGETGQLLGDILGFGLGGAFTALAATVKVAATAVEAFSTAVNFVLTPVRMLKDEAASLATDIFAQTAAEVEKAAASQRELDAAYRESAKGTGTLASDMQALIDLSGRYALSIAEEGLAHLGAAQAAERRMQSESAMWDKLAKQQAAAEDKAAFDAFEKANAMGPELPPGFGEKKKKGKAKKEKDLSGQGLDAAKRFEAETRRDREQAFAAEVAAFEKESAARDQRIAGIGREIEIIEARGIAEAEQVDFIFATVEIETEAARMREALIDQRLAKEAELARWQVKAAKTAEQREKAQTRLEEVEHAKRTRAMEKAAAKEAKTARQREQVFGTLAAAHNTLAETMIDAAFAAAEGEKVAVAAMIQELLKGVAKKHALLALAEAALAVGAAASYRYAAAAQHGASAALHGSVAALAGVGAYAAGQLKPQQPSEREEEQNKWAEEAATKQRKDAWKESQGLGGKGGGSSGRGGAGGGDGDGDDLEQTEVPVTHEQLRRGDPRTSRGGAAGGPSVVFNGPVNIYGAGGKAEFIDDLRRSLDRQDRRGARPRN